MRILNFAIFFSVFLTIYGLANYYIYLRGLQALPKGMALRYCYMGLFICISLSYLIGRLLERFTVCRAGDVLIWIGSYWFAFVLYFFMAVLFLDLLRAGNYFFGFFPDFITANYQKAKFASLIAVVFFVSAIVIAGHVNTLFPKTTRLELTLPAGPGGPRNMDLVLVTDIHLGVLINNSRLEALVKMINDFHPDAVLLAGDIVDEDIAPVIEKNLGELLTSIQSRLGVFAVTGNHEYIGGADAGVKYLEEHGVRFLRDEALLLDGAFYLAGREDRSIRQFNGRGRKDLGKILDGLDRRYPVILMDHQPLGLHDAVRNGVALQVSGHTHNGQLWPIHLITRRIFEISYGYGKIGNTHVYVSDGFGTWGPPVRTVDRPEIVHLRIRLASEAGDGKILPSAKK